MDLNDTPFPEGAFARKDETDDREFYGRPRLVPHLDALALETVEGLISELCVGAEPAVLDLMASWDSHLPEGLAPREVVGLGMSREELERNPRLTERVVHDLNARPRLPFEGGRFDAVLNVVSVNYLTRPVEVFAEVGRVLEPGGLFLVVFSNRMFPEKAVALWRQATEEERVLYVEELFRLAGSFGPTTTFVSKGRRRPAGDRYAALGLPSDPVYAVYAEKAGGPPSSRPRPQGVRGLGRALDPEELGAREDEARRTLRCPHCGERLRKYAVPVTPFTEWDTDYLYVCFNDECPYLLRGFEAMARQGNVGFSYRLMLNPVSGGIGPVPVQSLAALREGIVD